MLREKFKKKFLRPPGWDFFFDTRSDGNKQFFYLGPNSVSLLLGGAVQPEKTYSRILKMTGQVWESQKKGKYQH